jgi:hypothetical protein
LNSVPGRNAELKKKHLLLYLISICFAMTFNPSDISELLFPSSDGTKLHVSACTDLSYVGPISVVLPNPISLSSVAANRGRCLIATRTLEAGELLFVSSPIVASNVKDVWNEWKADGLTGTPCSVSEAAERVLLKTCRECITQNRPGILQCLTALERSGITLDDASATSISRLLGQDDKCSSLVELSDDDILQIIRRNAFGPDFITMDRIERRWTEVNYDSITDLDEILPTRILGLYPLAAMVNHSCIPNSVRVFVGETMIVHTCQSIAAGDEIVWSYIPLIEGYNRRQMLLLETHNFSCRCVRCRSESTMSSELQSQLMELRFRNINDVSVVNQLEDCILQDTRLSNEMKRYIRISFLQSYVNYLNEMLMLKTISYQQLLAVSFQLHLSLFACHNASTEHLSVGFELFVCCKVDAFSWTRVDCMFFLTVYTESNFLTIFPDITFVL